MEVTSPPNVSDIHGERPMSVATTPKTDLAADRDRRFGEPAQYLDEGCGLSTLPMLVEKYVDAVVTTVLLPGEHTPADDAAIAAARIYEECRAQVVKAAMTARTVDEFTQQLAVSFLRGLAERYWQRYPDHKRLCDAYWRTLGLDGAA